MFAADVTVTTVVVWYATPPPWTTWLFWQPLLAVVLPDRTHAPNTSNCDVIPGAAPVRQPARLVGVLREGRGRGVCCGA